MCTQEQSSIIAGTILGTTILFERFVPPPARLALTRTGDRDAPQIAT